MSDTNAAFSVLGVRVCAVQIPNVIAQMEEWIAQRKMCRFIAVTGMHGIMEAQHDSRFKTILNSADLVVPDGMPLIWVGRTRGIPLQRRVYGPEMMLAFFASTASKGYRHFMYGGAPGVPERLAKVLMQRFPGTVIAGTYSPPFGPPTPSESTSAIEMINNAAPDIVWVGLSTPKQERWMRDTCSVLEVPVLVGVGAAFDIHSGIKKQAPVWMREHGFEWLYRLLQEPRRLWRRYIIYGAEFVFCVALELLGLRRQSE